MAAAVDAVRKPFVGELLGRSDFAIIGEIVEPGSKVLDLGCGEGELLQWLAENKGVEARGVEISATKVRRAIARGQCEPSPKSYSLAAHGKTQSKQRATG